MSTNKKRNLPSVPRRRNKVFVFFVCIRLCTVLPPCAARALVHLVTICVQATMSNSPDARRRRREHYKCTSARVFLEKKNALPCRRSKIEFSVYIDSATTVARCREPDALTRSCPAVRVVSLLSARRRRKLNWFTPLLHIPFPPPSVRSAR